MGVLRLAMNLSRESTGWREPPAGELFGRGLSGPNSGRPASRHRAWAVAAARCLRAGAWLILGAAGLFSGCRRDSPSAGNPHVEILSPVDDLLIHDATPDILVTYRDDEGDLDPDTLRCVIDGETIPSRSVAFESGAVLIVPPKRALGDGRHELEVTLSDSSGHTGLAATTFRVSLHAKQTVLKGRVVGSRKRHGIEGLTVRLEGSGLSTLTDGEGEFVLRDVPAGRAMLRLFYPTAPGESTFPWTVQRLPVFVLGGAVNELPQEITLVEANTAVQWEIRPEDVDPAGRLLFDLVLLDEGSLAGMTLPIGTRITFADGSHVGHTLALTQLRADASPVPLDMDVPFIYHLGPHGVILDPPASFTVANFEQDFLPGNTVDLLRFNEEAGIYQTYGSMTTDTDLLSGTSILRDSGFYVPVPSPAQGSVVAMADDANPIHPGPHPFGLRRGNVVWQWSFPPYRSVGRERSVRLGYSSKRAWPSYTFRMDSIVPAATPLPLLLEARLSVMGVPIGRTRFFGTEGLTDFSEISSVQAVRLDAGFVPSGSYPFSFDIVSHYGATAVRSTAAGRVIIEGGKAPVGLPAGWVIEGLGRLEEGPDGTIVLRDGRETPLAFSVSPTDRLRFRLQQGDLDMEISPVKGTLSTTELYGYGTGEDPTSSNSGLEKPNTSFIFLYLDTQRATLSLVMINDSPGDGTGGRRGYSLFGLPSSAYLDVADDPADDLVVRSPDGGLLWEWTPESNDGAIVSGLEGGFDLTVVPVETDGIAAFDSLQGSLTAPEVIHLPKRNGAVRLIARSVAATELPDEITYLSPPGEASSLSKLKDNTFVRTFSDGAREEYDATGLLTVAVTATGERTEYAYDTSSRLVTIRDPAGKAFDFDYEGGYLARISDPTGRQAVLETDSSGRLTGLTEPGGASWEFGYDPYDLLTSRTDPRGIVTTYEYSPFGTFRRAETREDPLRIEPDESDLLAATDLEGGPHAGFPREDDEPSGLGRDHPVPTVLSDEVPWVVREGWDGVIYFDENDLELPKGGLATTYQFDAGGHVTGVTDPGGLITSLSWNGAGLLERLTSPAGRQLELLYDTQARLTQVIRRRAPDDTATQRTTAFGYDIENGRLATVDRPEGQQVHFDYDARRRLERIVDGNGNETHLAYEDASFPSLPTSLSRDVSFETAVWRFGHDQAGNLSDLVDPSGARSVIDRDRAGRIVAVRDGAGRRRKLGHDKMNHVTSLSGTGLGWSGFHYDRGGHLIRVRDAGDPPGNWLLDYDGMGRLASVTDPTGLQDIYTYDILGRLVRADLRNGDALAWDYDTSGRLIQKSLLPALEAGELVAITPDPDGRPLAMTDADASISATYSGFSEIATVSNSQTAQFPAVTVSLGHDRNGRLVSIDDGSSVRTLGYDDGDQLTSFGDSESGASAQVFRDDAGRVGLISLSNGVSIDFTNDDAGRVTVLEELAGSTTISRWEVTERNGAGDPLVIAQERSPLPQADRMVLSNDAAGRLVGRVSKLQRDEVFSYDPAGHRTDGGAVIDLAGRRLSDSRYDYLYDALGRLVRRDAKQAPHAYDLFRYDVEGHLLEVKEFSSREAGLPSHRLRYRYDPFGRCIEREADGAIVRYVQGAGRLLAGYASSVENPAANRLAMRFLGLGPRSSPLLMREDSDGDGLADKTFTFLPDVRGVVADVLDESLGVRQSIFTSSYGEMERAVDGDGNDIDPGALPVDQPFGLAAGLYEPGPRLLRLGGRVLDTGTGLFLTENPLGLAAGTNAYGYALDNPYRFEDPLGLVALSLESGGVETSDIAREAAAILEGAGPSLRLSGFLVIDPEHPVPPLGALVGEAERFLAGRLPLFMPAGSAGGLEQGERPPRGFVPAARRLSESLGMGARGGAPADWPRAGVGLALEGPLGLTRRAPWVLR